MYVSELVKETLLPSLSIITLTFFMANCSGRVAKQSRWPLAAQGGHVTARQCVCGRKGVCLSSLFSVAWNVVVMAEAAAALLAQV